MNHLKKSQIMNKYNIKKIAENSIVNGKLNSNAKNFVLKKFKKKDLNIYLFYLKKYINKNNVYVTISDNSDEKSHGKIAKIFKGKNIYFKVDKSLGAGFRIEYEDFVIEENIKNLINKSISNF